MEQLDRTGNVDRAFHAVIYAELGRDRSQALIFKEIAIGRRRLGSYSARELGWLIVFFGELTSTSIVALQATLTMSFPKALCGARSAAPKDLGVYHQNVFAKSTRCSGERDHA